MRVCVIGTGYVGLVAGACFSDTGNHVVCVDVDKEKVEKLSRGEPTIFEPGLDQILERNIQGKRLEFTTNAVDAIRSAQVIFVAVGTPHADDGSLDLKYVKEALTTIAANVEQRTVVVMKSTVPVGTAEMARQILATAKVKVDVVSNPEFLKEGTAVEDFLKPERVVIGCASEEAEMVMKELYAPYVRSGNPILVMSNKSAEVSKYAANSFLAMKISFINEVANLCETVDADVRDVRQVLISDSRIGKKFLYPGCGYGGSCFPKDVQAMMHLGEKVGQKSALLQAVHTINESQKELIFNKIYKFYNGDLAGKTIAVWGLAFKPMTDDMREAPAVAVIEKLLENGCKVQGYDPVSAHEAQKIFEGKVKLFDNAYDALQGADALALMTEWNEFRNPDFDKLEKSLKAKAIFDGRNIYDPQVMQEKGFKYFCIGRQA